ncbi:hypothetical protein J2858_003105 [Neorhizobium galegae]|uniref:hypothetical protein n=1 Tax=Neorhizobium galegae TaxID=399 RepID=UPI001AE9343A|nr:hypothetical protein [Neorhizobium galegae]MBP2550169.1 hypothetical protein [Neorhizobium galegae]
MTGKFLKRGAIIDTIKSEERMNAVQKRAGKTKYHVDVVSCGCPDENCGAFHILRSERPLPSWEEAEQTLLVERQQRKSARK